MFLIIVDKNITAQALSVKKMFDGKFLVTKGIFHQNQTFIPEQGALVDTGGVEKITVSAGKMADFYSAFSDTEQLTIDDVEQTPIEPEYRVVDENNKPLMLEQKPVDKDLEIVEDEKESLPEESITEEKEPFDDDDELEENELL